MTSFWMRRIALGVGALVLLLVVAVGVLIATFDANRTKSLAIDWMKTTHQRTLVMDGPVELSFFPRLAVKVSKLSLSEHGRKDEFAAITEASLAVQVLPLLRKELVVARVSARGVRLTYLRDAKGVSNIDDLLSAKPTAGTEAPPAPPGGPALSFDVSAVQFDDLHLTLRDDSAKLAGDVVLQTFTSGRLTDRVETPVTLRAAVQLTQPQAVKLSFDGRTTLALDLDKNAVSLTGAKLQIGAFLTPRYCGMRNFGKIFGIVYIAIAAGSGIGPVLAGHIHDVTGSYDALIIAGIPITLMCGVMLMQLGPYPEFD